jgi:hypothetical protein
LYRAISALVKLNITDFPENFTTKAQRSHRAPKQSRLVSLPFVAVLLSGPDFDSTLLLPKTTSI